MESAKTCRSHHAGTHRQRAWPLSVGTPRAVRQPTEPHTPERCPPLGVRRLPLRVYRRRPERHGPLSPLPLRPLRTEALLEYLWCRGDVHRLRLLREERQPRDVLHQAGRPRHRRRLPLPCGLRQHLYRLDGLSAAVAALLSAWLYPERQALRRRPPAAAEHAAAARALCRPAAAALPAAQQARSHPADRCRQPAADACRLPAAVGGRFAVARGGRNGRVAGGTGLRTVCHAPRHQSHHCDRRSHE